MLGSFTGYRSPLDYFENIYIFVIGVGVDDYGDGVDDVDVTCCLERQET